MVNAIESAKPGRRVVGVVRTSFSAGHTGGISFTVDPDHIDKLR
jgi:hypothetical protein